MVSVATNQIVSINKLSDIIKYVNSPQPLSIVRMGNVEAQQMLSEDIYSKIKTNAGFFGDDIKKWKAMFLKSLINADLNLRVYTCPSFVVCDQVISKLNIFIPTLPYIEKVEFWFSLINAIQSDKIGFVSYFKKDIERQVSKLKWIYPHKKDKAHCRKNTSQWRFIYSENTIAGNEPKDKTWFDVLDDLVARCLSQDCDIYFISCGCYGLILCDRLKEAGKKAIYIGGLLQLLFGLKGKRWDERDEIKQYYNKYWIYPQTKPEGWDSIEGGCYWDGKE